MGNYEREEKAMRHLLLFCFSKSVFSRSNPRIFDTIEGFRNSENMYDPYEEFNPNIEAQRVHFYYQNKEDGTGHYELLKRISRKEVQVINTQDIPDSMWYMAAVGDQLAQWKKMNNSKAQEYFVHSKFDLTLSGSWSYGCYGQINPYRNGRGEPIDIIDEFYKEWQQCNTCIGIDFEQNQTANYSFCFDLNRRRFLCPADKLSNNRGQKSRCECDARLANRLARVKGVRKFNDGNDFDSNCFLTSKQYTSFKPNTILLSRKDVETFHFSKKTESRQCCGIYPSRYVFHATEQRQCCKTVVYDTQRNQCCADSLIGPDEKCREYLYRN